MGTERYFALGDGCMMHCVDDVLLRYYVNQYHSNNFNKKNKVSGTPTL